MCPDAPSWSMTGSSRRDPPRVRCTGATAPGNAGGSVAAVRAALDPEPGADAAGGLPTRDHPVHEPGRRPVLEPLEERGQRVPRSLGDDTNGAVCLVGHEAVEPEIRRLAQREDAVADALDSSADVRVHSLAS